VNLDGHLEVGDIVDVALSVGEELAFFFNWAWNRSWVINWAWNRSWVIGELEKTLSLVVAV